MRPSTVQTIQVEYATYGKCVDVCGGRCAVCMVPSQKCELKNTLVWAYTTCLALQSICCAK